MPTFSQAKTVFSDLIDEARAVGLQWQSQATNARFRGDELKRSLRAEIEGRWAELQLGTVDPNLPWVAPLGELWGAIDVRQTQAIEQAASYNPEADHALGEAEDAREQHADGLLWQTHMRLERNPCERGIRHHVRRFGGPTPQPTDLPLLPSGLRGWLMSWVEPTAVRHLRRTIRRTEMAPEDFWGQVAQAHQDRDVIPTLEKTVRQAREQARFLFERARQGQEAQKKVLSPDALQQAKNRTGCDLLDRLDDGGRRSLLQALLSAPLKVDTWLFTEQQAKACRRLSDQAHSGKEAADRVVAQLTPTHDKLAKATRSGRGYRSLPAGFDLGAVSAAVAAALVQIKAPHVPLSNLLGRLSKTLDTQEVQRLRTAGAAAGQPMTATSSSPSSDVALFWLWMQATPDTASAAFGMPASLGLDHAADLGPFSPTSDCWADLSSLSLPDVSVDTGSSYDSGSSASYDSGSSCGGGGDF